MSSAVPINKKVTQNRVTLVDLETTVRDISILEAFIPEKSENELESINLGVTRVTAVTATNGVTCSGNPNENARVTGVTDFDINCAIDPNETPPMEVEAVELDRPCYAVYDDYINFGDSDKPSKPGVYYHGLKSVKKDEPPVETNDYICDPLHIDAGSCDIFDNNFGLMLRFKNSRNRWRQWLMPMGMLSGSCEDLRNELLSQGLRIDHHKRNYLPSYLQSQRPKKQLESALKIGWHDECFVLPDRVIGNRDDIFFQTDHAVTAPYGQRGALKDWQQHISRYCVGNPLLLFQVSIGFAGAMLRKCNVDYVGFHVYGDSSTGKSTGHKIAASIWGGESFRKSWKATGNGLEAAAVLYNDGLLALDELGDSDAREVNQIVYSLGNGTGKQRANVRGTARQVATWKVALLSNGEKTLETFFQEKGLSVKAGQSVRLLQIPVFGQHGAFDELHGIADGRLFSDTLQNSTTKYYGSAGIAFIEALVADDKDFGGYLEEALKPFMSSDLQPQEKRAARAFALVALAGELATEYSVTGWTEGAALEAALICFNKWRDHRGKGATEDRVILQSIRGFIDKFSDSRFTSKDDRQSVAVSAGRAGYFTGTGEDRIYLFNEPGLKEAAGVGYDIKRIVEALTKANWLIRATDGKPKAQHKVDGKNAKFYTVAVKECEQ
ncbi:MAG: DUF927 domain-containing protein [Methylobacter sp.]|nr:DUF927 domain-containing protein [Methylobacter sp.]